MGCNARQTNKQLKYENSNRFYNLTHTLVHKTYAHEKSVLRYNLLHVRAGFGIRLLTSDVLDIQRTNYRNYSSSRQGIVDSLFPNFGLRVWMAFLNFIS
jgi:hypothetical protein